MEGLKCGWFQVNKIIIATFFERKTWALDKAKILKSFGWEDVVIKPL